MKKLNKANTAELSRASVAERLEAILNVSFDRAWEIVCNNYNFAIWSMLGKKRITLTSVTNKVIALCF